MRLSPLLILVAAFAIGADWPTFRANPQQTGVTAESLPNPLQVCWTFKAQDSFEGAAAIAGGAVYVGSMDEHVYALDLATGKPKWTAKTGASKVGAAFHRGSVYIGDLDGVFHCLDAVTGKPQWQFKTEAEITSAANFAQDNALFGSADEHLYCVGPDGKLRWKFKVAGGPVLATPAVAGERTFVSGCDSTLHVLDLNSGRELASLALEGQTGSSAAVAGDALYLGTMTNEFLCIDWHKAHVLWRFEAKHPKPFYASAAVTDSLVIAGSRDKNVYALDRKTGKVMWTYTTEGHVDSSAVIAGGLVYACSMDGKLYVLDLHKGSLIQQMTLGNGISASPAVAGGRLIIGNTEGVLQALAAKSSP